MAAETDSPPRASSKRENVFTRKIGPMPMWAWLAIVGTVIIGYAYWKNRQSSTASTSSTTADASQVPQFVNQTYTTVQPPSEPPPAGATGPQGPQGPQGPTGPSDDDTTKKKPVNRKHPTHDAGQDARQAARKEARQDKRQGSPATGLPPGQVLPATGIQGVPGTKASRVLSRQETRKNARIAARRKG